MNHNFDCNGSDLKFHFYVNLLNDQKHTCARTGLAENVSIT